MEFLFQYGLFFAKTVTVVVGIVVIIILITAIRDRSKHKAEGQIYVEKLNDKYQNAHDLLSHVLLSKHELKKQAKELKKTNKEKKKKEQKDKKSSEEKTKKLFVLTFHGDIHASEADLLKEEITALLTIATPEDNVLVILESTGGTVHNYGFAASQLMRIRQKNIHLTIAVDRVAASGGYMMAVVADKIIAAPFAVVGSIGVVAQLPNFNKLLKKHNIDYEQITAGQYKRTLTLFGENTTGAREKFKDEIEETHSLFKDFVSEYRPQLNMEKVATGEHWYGKQALALELVDELTTSDDYLMQCYESTDIYKITYEMKRSIKDKFSAWIKAQTKLWNNSILSKLGS